MTKEPEANFKPTEFGGKAEDVAAAYLEKHGYALIQRNYHTRRGEIDIIARDGDIVVFVEVKAATKRVGDRLYHRVNASKQRKLYFAASEYIQKFQPVCETFRFDVVMMVQLSNGEWQIEHLRDAFRLDEFSC